MLLRIKIQNFYRTLFVLFKRLLILILSAMLISFCDSSSNPGNYAQSSFVAGDYSFPYNLDKPDAELKLPGYLEEISGLSYYKKDKFVCVEDEQAIIYVLQRKKELDVSKFKFGKDGDYEDIAIQDETAYVLRNDGSIFRVKGFTGKDQKVKKYKTPLSEKNDTEGIAYDPLSNSLLISCKGSPSIEKDNPYKGNRAIYRFDLKSKELVTTPLFLIDLTNLNNYRDQGTFSKFSAKLAKKLRIVDSETSFKPSGLSIHPHFGDIYIISSVGKLLIVMDRRGQILDIHGLDDKLFRQPEGICFSPSGDLFISSEGQGGKGYILKFNLSQNE
jgi:uncharacterized protein YjiK